MSDTKKKSEWTWLFVEALKEVPNVARAAEIAGISRQRAYQLRGEDPSFAAAWDHALGSSVDALEAEAFRRAKDGTDKPVFHMGAQCGVIREYSDTLAIFLLKAHKPEYREKQTVALTGSGDSPLFPQSRQTRLLQDAVALSALAILESKLADE